MPRWAPIEAGSTADAADVDDEALRLPSGKDEGLRPPGPPPVEEDSFPARGLYLGGSLISALPMGDFDGEQALAGMTDLVLIPDLDVGAGFGGYISYRWYQNELLLQYEVTENDGEHDFTSLDHDTTFYNLDLNLRHYFWPKSALEPYALIGVGWGEAEIDDGSVDKASIIAGQPPAIVKDAELEDGISVNVGAGLALYPLPWVVLFGEGVYRFMRYGSSEGIDGTFSNIGDVDGDGWRIAFGAAIRLLPGHGH